MAKKIALSTFDGVSPSVPDYALKESNASRALNVRLSDTSIRPYYQPVVSPDTYAKLSPMTSAYTNFIKGSYELPIAWLAWSTDTNVSILETRYNDVSWYALPATPESAADGALNVLFSSTDPNSDVSLDNAEPEPQFHATYTYAVESSEAPEPTQLTSITQKILGYVKTEIGVPTTFAWTFVSGDATIAIDNAAIAEPTFTLPALDAPSTYGTEDKSAVWQLVIDDDDTPANSGKKTISIEYVYRWSSDGSGGGDGGGLWDECVWVEAYLPNNDKAGDAVVGTPLQILNETHDGTVEHPVTANSVSLQETVLLTTASGIQLTCSVSTPLTSKHDPEALVLAPDGLGHLVPVLDGGEFRWERIISVVALGKLEVAHISCDDNVYAAGNVADRYILTHNARQIKKGEGDYIKP